MYLIDGSDKYNSYKVSEFIDYFLYNKKNFQEFLPKAKEANLYPEKCDFCNYCNWSNVCGKRWEEDNYINQVYGIIKSQVVKFKKEEITTVEALAKADPNKIKAKINLITKIKLNKQAKLQEEKRITGISKYFFNNTEKDKGFYSMPIPNEGDLFYDIEGLPQGSTRNFEYLHGIYYNNGGGEKFKYFVVEAYNKNNERKIFEDLINFFDTHFKKYPNAFIYHYHHYETEALKNLASEYSSIFPKGNHLIDNLLRRDKFVDLCRIVTQCMQTTEKDLSLKTIEKFYRKNRDADIKSADDSIGNFELWAATGDPKLMDQIISYNEEDCISTFDLREFLKEKRPKDFKWFSQSDEEKNKNSEVKDFEVKEHKVLLKLESKKNKDNETIVNNLKDLAGFHRRESKPKYWDHYKRLTKDLVELEDDPECIGNALRENKDKSKDSDKTNYIYRFNEQNFKLKEGDQARDIVSETTFGSITKITEIKDDENFVELSISQRQIDKNGEPPAIFNFGPPGVVNTKTIADALDRFIVDYSESKNTKYKCAEDILKNSFPNIRGIKPGEPIINIKNDLVDESIKAVNKLNSSYLLVQGPPGTGKTYTSAKIILSLIRDNKKVGITSNSHKAINNLLLQIEELALREKFSFKGMKKSSKEEQKLNGKIIEDINAGMKSFPDEYLLYAGTAWLFSDPRFDQKIDYLFIDEAGQVSLANTLAIATSTKNIILIGDQMQLSQPIQGIHAGNSGKSALDFLLENEDTIPVTRGIFLGETRRLNKEICDYISSSFYDFRLKPHSVTSERSVTLELKDIKDKGIFYIPTKHTDCTQRSDEEGKLINDYLKKILGKTSTDNGKNKKIDHDDIMVVAPFNMQVNNLKKIIDKKESRVGTIDKFQGQEAKIVFISMTSSDPENLPRHKDFFFSRNRLNVAISRAQCVAVILFNPNLLLTNCAKINEMRLVNNFCKLVKYEIL